MLAGPACREEEASKPAAAAAAGQAEDPRERALYLPPRLPPVYRVSIDRPLHHASSAVSTACCMYPSPVAAASAAPACCISRCARARPSLNPPYAALPIQFPAIVSQPPERLTPPIGPSRSETTGLVANPFTRRKLLFAAQPVKPTFQRLHLHHSAVLCPVARPPLFSFLHACPPAHASSAHSTATSANTMTLRLATHDDPRATCRFFPDVLWGSPW